MQKKSTVGVVVGILALLVGFGLLAAGGVGLYLWLSMRGGDAEEIAERLPADAGGVLVARGFAELALEFRGLAQPAADGGQPSEAQERFAREFEETMGFRPDDPQGWASAGVDFTRPWGLGVSALPDLRNADDAEWTALVPVTDGDRATALAMRLLEKGRASTQPANFGAHAGYLIEDSAALAVDDDYLVLVGSGRRGFDPSTAMRLYLDRDRASNLAKQEPFKGALQAVGDEWQVLGYAPPATLAAFWAEADADARAAFGDLGDAGAVVSGHLDDLALTQRMLLLQTAPLPPMLKGGADRLSDRLSGAPLAVGRLGLDYGAAWEAGMARPEVARDLQKFSSSVRDEWGVDVKTDLVDNLDGPLSFAAVKGGDLPHAVGWVGLKDPKKANTLLDVVVARLRDMGMRLSDEKAGEDRWVTAQDNVALGVVDHDLIVTFGAGRLNMVKADLKGGATGFAAGLPAAARAELQGGPPIFLYYDVAQLLAALDGNVIGRRMLDRDTRQLAGLISGVSTSLDIKGRNVEVRSTFYAPKGGFSAALNAMGQGAGR